MPQEHDGIYRRLFSHRVFVEDLVRTLLGDEAMDGLRSETLEQVPAHYVSEELQQREDDSVWRLEHNRGGGGWFYIYVLIEFQSQVDRFMALRVMTYTGLLLQDLVRRGEIDEERRLPPVLPVVLYNGDPKWSAPLELEPLISDAEPLVGLKPNFRYLLVDEARYPLRSLPKGSPLRALLSLEQARDKDQLLHAVRLVRKLVDHLDDDELRRDIEVWLRRVLVPDRFPKLTGRPVGGLRDMETRLERTVRGWTQEWLAQGEAKGRAEGVAEGRAEGVAEGRAEGLAKGKAEGLREGRLDGQRDTLRNLLMLRFGALTPAANAKIATADEATLDRWVPRVLSAESVDDVLR